MSLSVELSFDLPYRLRLPEDSYRVQLDGSIFTISISVREQERPDPRLKVSKSSNMEILRDRHGLLAYSHVKVSVPENILTSIGTRTVDGATQAPEVVTGTSLATISTTSLFEVAVAVINQLVRLYRFRTNEFHIVPIPREEVNFVEVVWYVDGQPSNAQVHKDYGAGAVLIQPIEPSVVKRIRDELLAGAEIPIAFELFSDAKDHLDQTNYRLAVIDARTALEVFVDQVLLSYFSGLLDPIQEAVDTLKLDKKRKYQDLDDAIQRAWINNKLGPGLCAALPQLDLEQKPAGLWCGWLAAKRLREGAAHRGAVVDKQQARDAVNAMGMIMSEALKATGSDWELLPYDE
ncbi:MAG: hypothetical protein M1305_01905 [Candidatus Marsarchaeota archaeon]|nr:hypothetical protein [Candidatus Marsarchaeota archaeon]